jgi:hypothetical protein
LFNFSLKPSLKLKKTAFVNFLFEANSQNGVANAGERTGNDKRGVIAVEEGALQGSSRS